MQLQRNIVLAGGFNPSMFDKLFFVKNKIFTEEEIKPDSIITVMGVRVMCEKYSVEINPLQIITFSNSIECKKDNIIQVVISIINAANLNNITAIGMNFTYITDDVQSLEDLTRGYFYTDQIKLFADFFNEKDAMFGVYTSKNFKDARLKLDVKPNIIKEGNELKNKMVLTFNCHFDVKKIKDENQTEVINYLNEYDQYYFETERIISIY
jgi:hypothetical protein